MRLSPLTAARVDSPTANRQPLPDAYPLRPRRVCLPRERPHHRCDSQSHRWCACLAARRCTGSCPHPSAFAAPVRALCAHAHFPRYLNALCTRSAHALLPRYLNDAHFPRTLHMRSACALLSRLRTARAHSVGGAALSSVRGVGSLAVVPRQWCERGAMGPGRPTPAWTLLGRSGLAGTEFDLDSVVSELCNRVVQTLLVKQYPPGLLLNCTGSGLTPPALGAGTTSARARSH
jgi:hypothetical protein